jgi:endonuclease YncB( thermonuclease family)
MKNLLLPCLLLLSGCLPDSMNKNNPEPGYWQVVDGSIHDGDTLRLTNGSREEKIRLCGIDAPELDQPGGIAARDRLQALLLNRTIKPYFLEKDRYQRTVAELFTVDDDNQEVLVNGQLVMEGLAWHYQQYSKTCPNQTVIAQSEEYSIRKKLGVHGDSKAIKPWNWRKNK